jgi:hypothetical protein
MKKEKRGRPSLPTTQQGTLEAATDDAGILLQVLKTGSCAKRGLMS